MATSTKQKLFSLIDDVEIVSKELFDVICTPKDKQRPDSADSLMLLELLAAKDKEIKETSQTAEEQAEIQKNIDDLKGEVDKRDVDIKHLQKSLKEAETILATAIYQAKQKLSAIHQASKKSISSEEFIKFAHRISASNAVAAPATWVPGDPRRPYPTDLEMRHGFLGKLSDLPHSSQVVQSQGSYSDAIGPTRSSSQIDHHSSSSHTSSVSWQPPPELSSSLSTGSSHNPLLDSKAHTKDSQVELMSSDSSSSSSSDESMAT